MSGTELKLVRTVHTADVATEISIPDDFNDLFEGLGECKGEHHIKINPEVEYVIHLIKKVIFTLLPKLKQELKRVKQLGVQEKVDQPTEWVNSILMLEKPDGNLRICLDPKDWTEQWSENTSNSQQLTGEKVFGKLDAKDGF